MVNIYLKNTEQQKEVVLLRMHFPLITFFMLLVKLSILGCETAQAQEITLRLHHFLPTMSTAHAKFIEPWARKVTQASQGQIKFDIFPSMQLGGKPPQLYDQVRDGVVDIVWTLPGYTPGRFPIVELFELPFIASTAEATSQAMQVFAQKYLQKEFGHIHPLLIHVHAPGVLHTKTKPIGRLQDLAGMKIRAPSRSITDALSALGAVPLGMPVPEVPQALTTGVIDGAVLPWEVTRPLRIHEIAKHHTELDAERGLYTAVFLFAMNKAKYESLPTDLKRIIDNNSGMDLARQVGKVWDESEGPGRAAAEKRGNQILVISGKEIEQWRSATRPVIEAWVKRMNKRGLNGEEMLEEAQILIERYTKK